MMAESEKEDNVINIKEFLQQWTEIVPDSFSIRNKNVKECIKADMKLTDPQLEKLENVCNVEQLCPEDEIKSIKDSDELKETKLSSVNYVLTNYSLSTKRCYSLGAKLLKQLGKMVESETDVQNMIELPDVVLTVQISQSLTSKAKNKFSWSEEFLVLGQNYLTVLSEKIMCFRNHIIIGEFSQNPDDVKNSVELKDAIPSSFFFIENTFYNDCRNGSIDCSVEIMEWAKEREFTLFQTKKMEETKFLDLNIKLGHPYLYTHLGNCEHLILFLDIRLVNPSVDSYELTKYPILKDRNRGRLIHCWLCNFIYAKWVVCKSELVVDDPCLLCERCLKNTHYDENDKKICDFNLYHFSQLI